MMLHRHSWVKHLTYRLKPVIRYLKPCRTNEELRTDNDKTDLKPWLKPTVYFRNGAALFCRSLTLLRRREIPSTTYQLQFSTRTRRTALDAVNENVENVSSSTEVVGQASVCTVLSVAKSNRTGVRHIRTPPSQVPIMNFRQSPLSTVERSTGETVDWDRRAILQRTWRTLCPKTHCMVYGHGGTYVCCVHSRRTDARYFF